MEILERIMAKSTANGTARIGHLAREGAAAKSFAEILALSHEPSMGQRIHDLIARLYPIPRSLTGDGLRRSLSIVGERIPLEIHEVPSGARALDWTVPKEWNVREAYVANSRGERVIDYARSSLHLLGYSVPVRGTFSLAGVEGAHFHNSLTSRLDSVPLLLLRRELGLLHGSQRIREARGR